MKNVWDEAKNGRDCIEGVQQIRICICDIALTLSPNSDITMIEKLAIKAETNPVANKGTIEDAISPPRSCFA